MNDYAAWRSRVLRGPARSSLPREDATTFAAPLPPPPPLPPAVESLPYASAYPPAMPAPPLSAAGPSTDHSGYADVGARLAEVLRDIEATERGQERAWLNVQPCVLHTIKLLVAAAQSREVRLQRMENTVHHAQECLSVLVRDREVKEERYHLDVAAHKAETEQLWKRVLLLEAQEQQQQQREQLHLTSAKPSSTSPPAVDSRFASLEEGLHRVQRQLQQSLSLKEQRARRPLSSRSSSASSADSTRRGGHGADRPHAMTAATSRTPSPVTQRMLAEVHRLRRQWKHFLRTIPAALLRTAEAAKEDERDDEEEEDGDEGSGQEQIAHATRGASLRHSSAHTTAVRINSRQCLQTTRNDARMNAEVDSDECTLHSTSGALPMDRGMASLLPSSGRRVRWHTTGEVHGRAATPTNVTPYHSSSQRSPRRPMGSGDGVALSWAEWHAFDGRTDCWYNLGSWATHHRQVQNVQRAEEVAGSGRGESLPKRSRFRWMARATELVAWAHPTRITIQRGGLYEVKVCYLRHRASACAMGCAGRSSTDGAVLSLCVNGAVVTGLQEAISHTPLYTQPPSSASPLRQGRGPLHSARTAEEPKSASQSHVQHTHMEEAYRLLQRRPCCEPAVMHTHTLASYLYLPAGVELQVRCRELHSPHTVCEAFCELAYVV